MFTKSLTLFSVFIVELVSYRRKQLISERSAWWHVSPLSAMSFFFNLLHDDSKYCKTDLMCYKLLISYKMLTIVITFAVRL